MDKLRIKKKDRKIKFSKSINKGELVYLARRGKLVIARGTSLEDVKNKVQPKQKNHVKRRSTKKSKSKKSDSKL